MSLLGLEYDSDDPTELEAADAENDTLTDETEMDVRKLKYISAFL